MVHRANSYLYACLPPLDPATVCSSSRRAGGNNKSGTGPAAVQRLPCCASHRLPVTACHDNWPVSQDHEMSPPVFRGAGMRETTVQLTFVLRCIKLNLVFFPHCPFGLQLLCALWQVHLRNVYETKITFHLPPNLGCPIQNHHVIYDYT